MAERSYKTLGLIAITTEHGTCSCLVAKDSTLPAGSLQIRAGASRPQTRALDPTRFWMLPALGGRARSRRGAATASHRPT